MTLAQIYLAVGFVLLIAGMSTKHFATAQIGGFCLVLALFIVAIRP